ncbi:hypothetical protein [Nakamurella sp.]|uniref:hypothetical protein n=1 Tax=Nakamurella sp. TaxID=1869182 RepID=UPI003B3B7E5D
MTVIQEAPRPVTLFAVIGSRAAWYDRLWSAEAEAEAEAESEAESEAEAEAGAAADAAADAAVGAARSTPTAQATAAPPATDVRRINAPLGRTIPVPGDSSTSGWGIGGARDA